MLTFKDIAKTFYPLRWVQQRLMFSSVLGIGKLISLPFYMSLPELNREYDRMDSVNTILESERGIEFYNKVTHAMGAFRDIAGTLANIESGVILSELELFEIKYFTYHYEYFSTLLKKYELSVYSLEELSPVFLLLDPDQTGVVSFYMYDSYDTRLAELRKRNRAGDSGEELYQELEVVSQFIREKLSRELFPFIKQLKHALDSVAYLDLLLAKITFARENIYCRPVLGNYGSTSYEELGNPYLSFMIESRRERYQPVNITLRSEPTLITGANMSGKTMVLKSVALAQYLVQFGFYAPAKKARVALTEEVMLLVGDGQNENRGLSSFGGEIMAISDMIESVYGGKQALILLDEPARTTSPEEGVAIVDAVIELLTEKGVMSLITTHYNKLKPGCRCLRVKGFVENLIDETVNSQNINRFIDYRLVDAQANEGNSEALRVAKLLGVSDKLLNRIVLPEQKQISGEKLKEQN